MTTSPWPFSNCLGVNLPVQVVLILASLHVWLAGWLAGRNLLHDVLHADLLLSPRLYFVFHFWTCWTEIQAVLSRAITRLRGEGQSLPGVFTGHDSRTATSWEHNCPARFSLIWKVKHHEVAQTSLDQSKDGLHSFHAWQQRRAKTLSFLFVGQTKKGIK